VTQWLWDVHCQIATHSPFFVQPFTPFLFFINLVLIFFHVVDRVEYCKFFPKSLHPPAGRKYEQRVIPIWQMYIFWNLFEFGGYCVYDLLAGANTSMIWKQNHAASLHNYFMAGDVDPSCNSTISAIVNPITTTTGSVVSGAIYSALVFPSSPTSAMAPTFFQLLFDMSIMFIGFEINFFIVHRMLHSSFFWKHFHFRHHEVEMVDASAIYYADFTDGLINAFSILLPSFLYTGAHPMSRNFYYVLIGMLGACSHSGWDVAFGSSRFHFVHHMKHRCNYGVVGIMDRIFGSYVSLDEAIASNPDYKQPSQPSQSSQSPQSPSSQSLQSLQPIQTPQTPM